VKGPVFGFSSNRSKAVKNLLVREYLWCVGLYTNQDSAKMASAVRKIVKTAAAPSAIGPYNQAIIAGDTMYISGQLGMDPKTMELVAPDVESQTKQALSNMGEILKCAGLTFGNVVKTTVLLKDINDFVKVNDIYKTFFTTSFPARAAYQVAALPKGGAVEIEAVALVAKTIKDEVIEAK